MPPSSGPKKPITSAASQSSGRSPPWTNPGDEDQAGAGDGRRGDPQDRRQQGSFDSTLVTCVNAKTKTRSNSNSSGVTRCSRSTDGSLTAGR